jgi:hypothetical protein
MDNFQKLVFCAAAIASVFVLEDARCADHSFGAPTDQSGNVYPPECPDSIVDDPKLLAKMFITSMDMPMTLGGNTLSQLINGKPFIVLNKRYRGWRARDAKRHEMCHGVELLLGLPANWHPHQNEYVPN